MNETRYQRGLAQLQQVAGTQEPALLAALPILHPTWRG